MQKLCATYLTYQTVRRYRIPVTEQTTELCTRERTDNESIRQYDLRGGYAAYPTCSYKRQRREVGSYPSDARYCTGSFES
jgi:hypothetical protein